MNHRGLPSRQPRAQRGDEVALEEAAMGRGHVDRLIQRSPGYRYWEVGLERPGRRPACASVTIRSGVILAFTGISWSRSSTGTTLPK